MLDSSPPFRAPQAPDLPSTPFAFIWRYVARFRYWYVLIVFLEMGQAASTIGAPYALGSIVRAISRGDLGALKVPILLFAGLGLTEILFARSSGAATLYLNPLLRQRVTSELFAYIQYHSHKYFSERFAGALAHRISETSMGVLQTTWAVLIDFMPVAVKISVAATLLGLADWRLAAFVLVWSTVFITISYVLARRSRPHWRRYADARSASSGHVVDTVSNIASTRLFARLSDERERLGGVLDREVGAARIAHRHIERIRWFQNASSLVLKVGALSCALWLWHLGAVDAGTVVMCVSMALIIISEAANLGRRFLDFFEYLGNVENGVNTVVRPHDIVDLPGSKPVALSRGSIEFRNVSFRYHDGFQVFRDLSVTIPAGERVGLVGYSGSGKSTFVNLILRLYDPREGGILIDGEDIRRFTLESLHAQIGLIPQEPGLFHRSLADNIRYGKPQASHAEVRSAATRADAHSFITEMAQGYASLVGERGVKLSGGQRQRIAIARALLKNAPILILDEATSSLDSLTERVIQRTLDEAMRGKTVVVVAHRLSTIAHLDRILVFDGGRIVESGSHAQLLARGGLYHRLWTRQVDGFLPEDAPVPEKSCSS